MLASLTDYEQRHGPADNQNRVATLLNDASSLVREYVGDKFDTDTPGWVVALVCAAVYRTVRNPDGVRSESYVDAYSVSFDAQPTSSGVWFTADELHALAGPVIA